MTTDETRIYVVEDHVVMREMLADAIARLPGCCLVGMSTTGEGALADLERMAVDLVLVDVSLPQMSGVDLVRTLGQSNPNVPCLIVSGHVDASYAEMALEAGARGYVLKGRPADLVAGIRAAISGERFLSKPLEEKLTAN